MQVSKASLQEHSANRNAGEDQTETSKIFRIIKDMATSSAGARRHGGQDDEESDDEMEELAMIDVRARVTSKGFTETGLMSTILEYENMGILLRVGNGTRLRFVE